MVLRKNTLLYLNLLILSQLLQFAKFIVFRLLLFTLPRVVRGQLVCFIVYLLSGWKSYWRFLLSYSIRVIRGVLGSLSLFRQFSVYFQSFFLRLLSPCSWRFSSSLGLFRLNWYLFKFFFLRRFLLSWRFYRVLNRWPVIATVKLL